MSRVRNQAGAPGQDAGAVRRRLESWVAAKQEQVRRNQSDLQGLYDLGGALCQLGRAAEAQPYLQRAVELAPRNPTILQGLAECWLRLEQPGQALAVLDRALAVAPTAPPLLFMAASAHKKNGDLDSAIDLYERLLQVEPGHAATLNNLGNALTRAGRFNQAIDVLREAIRRRPNAPNQYYNLAKTLEEVLDLDGAEDAYRQALICDPEHAEARWSLAQLRWLRGDMLGAWQDYEARLSRRTFQRRAEIFSKPAWQGEAFCGKTLLLYAEQGHGDSIQFVRYVDMIAELGGTVVIECQPALVRLFRSLAGGHEIVARGDALPPFDLQCSIMSAPAIFKTEAERIPAAVPYLSARAQDRIPLSGDPSDLKVGLVWAGNPVNQPADSRRSFHACEYAPLLTLPGVSFYSLQVGEAGRQLQDFPEGASVVDLSDRLSDYAVTAAVIEDLDLVISSCTSVPHLAGALGKETWLILGNIPDFRWFLTGSETPWYPTLRLFRAPDRQAWQAPLAEIRSLLEKKRRERAGT